MFELLRDKKLIMRGTEIECWDYILDNHSFSVHWACQNEGYEIRPIEDFARYPGIKDEDLDTTEKNNG